MENQQGKTPQIRFPEFKDTWEPFFLGDLVYKTDKKNKENQNLPVYSINNTVGFVPQEEQFEGRNSQERGFDISIYKIIGSKTFAYNPARINVGSIGYSNDLENVLISSLYVCFKTKENFDDIFLLQYLNTNSFRVSVLRIQEGGVRQYLFFENLAKIRIFAPSIPEQTSIASFFTVLDKKIAQLKQKKTLLEQYKKGVMQKLFSQELRLKDENGRDFPKWERKKLGDLGEIITGSTPSTTNRAFYNGNFLFVSPGDIQTNRYVTKTENTLTEEGFFKGRKVRKGGSLFVCIGGTIGKIAQAGQNCITNQQINSVVPVNNNDDFVFFVLQHYSNKIASLAAEQAVPILNKTNFSSFELETPRMEEQVKIAKFINGIDVKINRAENQIQKTQEWKKGLLQKMFV